MRRPSVSPGPAAPVNPYVRLSSPDQPIGPDMLHGSCLDSRHESINLPNFSRVRTCAPRPMSSRTAVARNLTMCGSGSCRLLDRRSWEPGIHQGRLDRTGLAELKQASWEAGHRHRRARSPRSASQRHPTDDPTWPPCPGSIASRRAHLAPNHAPGRSQASSPTITTRSISAEIRTRSDRTRGRRQR